MKLINDDQFLEMQSDIAELINQIEEAKKNFDKNILVSEIVKEFKKSLSSNFSPFKSLEREALEIEDSLRELKKVKKIFHECKNKSDLKLIITSIISMFAGGIITLIIIKFISI